MKGIYEKGFNGNEMMVGKKTILNIYQKFSIAFALMSVIPFLVFFYLLVGNLGTADMLIGNIGLILSISMFIALLGLFDLRKAYERYEENRREQILSEKLSSMGRLLGEVAHKVNNPLQAVLGRARLCLMDGNCDPETIENLKIIMEQCKKASEVTQRLLMFSAPNKREAKNADVNHAVEKAVSRIKRQCSRDDVKIQERYAKGLPQVMIDSDEICEVVTHLIMNSLEAMPEGGRIKVSTRKRHRSIDVEITDTGEGISKEDINKLFDPYFTTRSEGRGIGLSVCYGIIKAHDGDLRYKSAPGKGTVVTMALPLAKQQAAMTPAAQMN
jgi:two-component system NtrC family sensor kinase